MSVLIYYAAPWSSSSVSVAVIFFSRFYLCAAFFVVFQMRSCCLLCNGGLRSVVEAPASATGTHTWPKTHKRTQTRAKNAFPLRLTWDVLSLLLESCDSCDSCDSSASFVCSVRRFGSVRSIYGDGYLPAASASHVYTSRPPNIFLLLFSYQIKQDIFMITIKIKWFLMIYVSVNWWLHKSLGIFSFIDFLRHLFLVNIKKFWWFDTFTDLLFPMTLPMIL